MTPSAKWRGFAHGMPNLPPCPFVALDLETTGLKHGVDRIVQVGVVRVMDDRDERYAQLVNPEMSIPAEATKVHGITDEMVSSAPLFGSVAAHMKSMFAGSTCIVTFNGRRFDVPFLQEELIRVGVEDFTAGIPVLDVMDMDRMLRPRTLAGVFKHYTGAELEDAHSAIHDVLATLTVLQAIPVDMSEPALTAVLATPERDRGMLDPHGWFRRREDGVVVMGRGMHEGVDLARVPLDYFQWMSRADDMPPRTRRTVAAVIKKRGGS